MKLFKNPVFAVFFCVLVIILSTCLNAKIKMEKKYDRVCDEVYEEIDEFAEKNGLAELRIQARTTLLNGDYDSLIHSYQTSVVSGEKYKDLDDVDEAIRDYNKFLRKTTRQLLCRAASYHILRGIPCPSKKDAHTFVLSAWKSA